MPWLDRSARQTTMTAGKFKGFDKFWTKVRRSTGVGIMFANIRNGLQQFTGYFPAMIKVGPSYLKGISTICTQSNAIPRRNSRAITFYERTSI